MDHSLSRYSSPYSTLNDMVYHQGNLQPDKIVYRFIESTDKVYTLTNAELNQKVQNLACSLHKRVKPGDRIILAARPGLDFVISFYACLRVGAIAVPIFPPANAMMTSRFIHVVNNAKPRLILCDKQTASQLNKGEKVSRFLPGIIKHFLGVNDELSSLYHTLRKSRIPILSTEVAYHDDATALSFPSVQASDVAFLQYTSGSTGNPRGVMLSHGNLLDNMGVIHDVARHSSNTHTFSWLPPYHDMGLIAGILEPLYAGGSATLLSTLDFIAKPSLWVEYISKYRCTTTGAPNFAYDLCALRTSEEVVSHLDLSELEVCANGAEPISPQTIELFYNKFSRAGLRKGVVFPCYGLAEATVMVSAKSIFEQDKILFLNSEQLRNNRVEMTEDKDSCTQIISSGIPQMDVVIVNHTTQSPCAEHEVGEIWISGPSVAQGYYNNSQETQELFNAQLKSGDPRSFLRTGDLGFLHQGELFVCGRLKNLIIINGQNYYPSDIERVVAYSTKAIRIGCVVAYSTNTSQHEALTVVAEIKRSVKPEEYDAIVAKIQNEIAKQFHLTIHELYLVPPKCIPKTTSGKLQRIKCAELIANGTITPLKTYIIEVGTKKTLHDDTPSWLPLLQETKKSKRQALLCELIAKRLENILDTKSDAAIDMDKGFFEFGINSLTAVELKTQIQEQLDNRLELDNSILFNYPTIRTLSHYILTELSLSAQPAVSQPVIESSQHSAVIKEDIAIIGMSAMFPGADSLEEFWELLNHGESGIREIDSSRFDIDHYYNPDPKAPGKIRTRHAGLINDMEHFDPGFFSITPKAAEYIDPQQRLLLINTWLALEHAAISPARLKGSDTGVFIGISSHDYESLLMRSLDDESINRYMAIGNSASTATGRLSYFLGLNGPNMAIDTACSSSLVAVHEACNYLLNNDCQMAIAGGVNVLLAPQLFINLDKAGMLSPEGRCKVFDEHADGYVRSEGCGIVILKRLSKAREDQDRILGVIKATGINQDGASSGLTVPNGMAQERLLNKVLAKAQLSPAAVQYVECHGTGTKLGDPIEANAIGKVYGGARSTPLLIGSVKANVGHLEAAAGIAGLIKVVLSLQHRTIPPQANFKSLNSGIHLPQTIQVASTSSPWNPSDTKAYAGISSFGFSGTNAHIIVGEAPITIDTPQSHQSELEHCLFVLSAKSEHSLEMLIKSYVRFLKDSPERLSNICYTAAVGRAHFSPRIAIIASSKQELIDALEQGGFQLSFATSSDDEALNSLSINDIHQAYLEGARINWDFFYLPYKQMLKKIQLPEYCFNKKRIWFR